MFIAIFIRVNPCNPWSIFQISLARFILFISSCFAFLFRTHMVKTTD